MISNLLVPHDNLQNMRVRCEVCGEHGAFENYEKPVKNESKKEGDEFEQDWRRESACPRKGMDITS